MNSRVPQLSWLENPEVFAVNRLPAHSDHRFYESEETMETGEKAGGRMPLRQCLNGTWKFSYAEIHPSERRNSIRKILMILIFMKSRFRDIFSFRDMINASILIPCIRGTDIRNCVRPK